MGKYRSSARHKEKPVNQGPHYIWTGLGCLMMVIIPVISFAAAYELINYGLDHDWSIPNQLLCTPRQPSIIYQSDDVTQLLSPLTGIKHLYAYTAFGVLIMILLSGIISLVYAIAYRVLGPSRWGPLDMPPPKFKTKKYTR